IGGPYFSSARSTISIARSTPAQKPRGWANTTRIVLPRRIEPAGPISPPCDTTAYIVATYPCHNSIQAARVNVRGINPGPRLTRASDRWSERKTLADPKGMALVVRDRARSGLGLPACRSGRRGLLCAARFLDVAGLRFGELASIACRSARVSTGTSVSLNRATDWPASPIPERSRGAARLDQMRGVPGLIEMLCTDRDDCRLHRLPRGIGRWGRTRRTLAAIARHDGAGQLRRYGAPPPAPGPALPAAPILAELLRAAARPQGFRRMRQPAGTVPSVRSGRRKQR